VRDIAPEVEEIIDRFQCQMLLKQIPVFKAEEEWQKRPEYQQYPEWANLNQDEIDAKAKELNISFDNVKKGELAYAESK